MRNLMLILLFLMVLFPPYISAQTIVDGKYTRLQMEREVITRWGKIKRYLLFFQVRDNFQPYWYFLLFHREYMMSDDKRNMLQLVPTLAFTEETKNNTIKEQEDVEEIFKQALVKGVDRITNKRWELFERDKFRELYERIDVEIQTTNSFYKLSERTKEDLVQTYLSIQDKVDIMRDSYIDDAEKGEAFRSYYNELEEYLFFLEKLNKKVKIMEKYDNIILVDKPENQSS